MKNKTKDIEKRKKSLFRNIWTSYAFYYFGRVNLSIIIPVLLATKGLTKYDLGLVTSGFFFAYAAGQFLHGQISERFNPYTYIAVGLIGSAIMNLLLGFSGGFFWLLFVGATMNGVFQSMGWSSTVRANSELYKGDEKNLESKSTILGTSYQVGNSVAWLASSFFVGWFGWEWGFYFASIALLLNGIILLRVKPKLKVRKKPLIKQIKHTFNFPITVAGFCLLLLNIVRYGVIVWIPTYLIEVHKSSVIGAGLKIFLIPIAGVLGTLSYNKLKINRTVLTAIFLSCLSLIFAVYNQLTGLTSVVFLILGGFFLYGPHVFFVSTFPSRFVKKEIVASSTGFIDGMAYIGAILVGILVPFFISVGGWNLVFMFWSIICSAIMALILVLYILMKVDGELAGQADILEYEKK